MNTTRRILSVDARLTESIERTIATPDDAPIKPKPGDLLRSRLLDAAEEVYAERGLDGASVRLLTQRAGVRLGAISELFFGLNELPRAVIERRHGELLEARRERLDALHNPNLMQIVDAYALPLIERARVDAGWKAYSRVWAQLVCAYSWDQKLGEIIDADAGLFIDLIAKGEPRLNANQTYWAFVLMMGAVASLCADNGRMDRLSLGRFHSADFDRIVPELTPFVAGGMEALVPVNRLLRFNELPVRRRRSKETRDVILDSAERMFAAHGFFGTSFRMIAKSSKLSVGLCQHYFGSKEGIFREVLQRRIVPLHEHALHLLAKLSDMPPGDDKLRATYSAAWLEPAARHVKFGGRPWRDHYRMLATAIHSQGQQWLDALDASHTDVTRSMVEALIASHPGVTPEMAYHAHLFLIGGMAVCYSTAERMRRLSGDKKRAEDAQEAYSMLLNFQVGGTLALIQRSDQADGDRK
jgi:AcrR family transcriptional regulator